MLRCSAADVLDPDTGDAGMIAGHFVERVIPQHAHVAAILRLRHQLVDENRFGPEFVPTVNDVNPFGDVRQIQSFLDRGVAAAADHDVLSLVEKPVTGRAGRDTLTHKRLLRSDAKIFRRGAGSDDQRVAGVFARVACQAEWLAPELRGMNVVEDDFGLEALGVFLKSHHQIRTLHAICVRWPIVDVGGRHQLATLREAGDQHRLQVRPRSVYCGRESGWPGAENQQSVMLGAHVVAFLERWSGF